MTSTLGGYQIQSGTLHIPYYGVATAGIEITSNVTLSGKQTLIVGDLSLVGTIVDGGPFGGVARYQWTAGAAGWRKPIAAKSWQSSLGVLRGTIIRDTATDAGETVSIPPAVSVAQEPREGQKPATSYARAAGNAWDVIHNLGVPWYVDGAGVTQVRERIAREITADLEAIKWDRDDSRRLIMSDSIAAWLPGGTIQGDQIVDLHVDLVPSERPRLTLFMRPLGSTEASHAPRASMARIVAQETSKARFHAIYEYYVKERQGNIYSLAPSRVTSGAPQLPQVEIWPGMAGHGADLPVNYRVHVEFADGDPGRPRIAGFESLRRDPPDRHVPTNIDFDAQELIRMGDHLHFVARETDTVEIARVDFANPAGAIAITITDSQGTSVTATITSGAGPLVLAMLPPLATGIDVVGTINAPSQAKVKA